MSDIPDAFTRQYTNAAKRSLEVALSAIDKAEGTGDFPDLRHARVKIFSAQRGLDDLLARPSDLTSLGKG